MAAKCCKSVKALAVALGVNQRTVQKWKSLHPDFPKRTKAGWPVLAWKRWVAKRELGKAATVGPTAAANAAETGTITLSEARRRLTIEKGERERLAKLREERTLHLELGDIVLLDDVAGIHERVAGTANSVLDTFVDRIERELPADMPDETKQRILEAGRRVVADTRAVIQEVVAGDGEEEAGGSESAE